MSSRRSSRLRGARITGSLHMTIQTAVLDRDLERARRAGALGLVQYLLDSGPCGRGHRRRRHAGVRGQGRDAGRVLGLHASHLRMAGRRPLEHDPGRWRRCDAAAAPRRQGGEGRLADRHARQRRRRMPVRRHQGQARRSTPSGIRRGSPRSRASPKRPPPGSSACIKWPRTGSWRFRRSTSTIRSPSRSSTICTAAANPWWTPSSAPPT